jgi:hypothetical protein
MSIVTIVFLVLWIAAPTYVAYRIGRPAGRQYAWAWGLLLGWIGVLIVWLLTRREQDQRERAAATTTEP